MRPLVHYILGAVMVVQSSAYTPHPSEGGRIAADGRPARPGHTVAVSRDLRHLFGKTIHIEGVGKREVHDIMAGRWKCSIDICFPNKKDANEYGRQKVVIREVK